MEWPQIHLSALLTSVPDVVVEGMKDVYITGLSSHSKSVAPGHLFVVKGNGARFIPDALVAGASALLTSSYNPLFSHVPQIICSEVPAAEVALARAFYDHPDEKLFLVGITGTNGKTTTSYLIRHLLGDPCGLIGTVEWWVGSHALPSSHTTPDVLQNYQLFASMVREGCSACVMEVSSHALDQQRVRGMTFDVGVFTNLTQDHLDYHHTMQAYAEAKAKLFGSVRSVAVINADSPYSAPMRARCQAQVIGYGIDVPCELKGSNLKLTSSGMTLDISYAQETVMVPTTLIGRYNAYNLLAAVGVGLARGLSLKEMAARMQTFVNAPGRLEPVPNPRGLCIYIDYAHTDDALQNVLQTLRELKPRRLITVFGCGGDRDRDKRPKMGAVAEALSDVVFVTSDNPRSESPEAILSAIVAGFKEPHKACVLPDRREAIARAVQEATPEDVVLIAGKGHERTQTLAGGVVPFDDREVALQSAY
jgi:UDP-N-acetylmuramoyl-L-alanyl-D-glutamate--2,6-diaminopimelate ligase